MIKTHLTDPDAKPENVIIFHDPCPDGWMSAVVARFYFGPGTCLFEGRNYDNPFDPAMLPIYTDKNVYILDFSMPMADLLEINTVAKKVVVLDHHRSFADRLNIPKTEKQHVSKSGPLEIRYDETMCGAEMTWRYLLPNTTPPVLLDYIADRDLWTWVLPNSRAVSAALHIEPRTFDRWLELMRRFNADKNFVMNYVENGIAILSAQAVEVSKLANRAFMLKVSKFFTPGMELGVLSSDIAKSVLEVPVVNTQSMQSEVCEKLLELHEHSPFSATFFWKDLNTRIWSLRARKNDSVDVSKVAKAWGGGGHVKAAGFTEKIIG